MGTALYGGAHRADAVECVMEWFLLVLPVLYIAIWFCEIMEELTNND